MKNNFSKFQFIGLILAAILFYIIPASAFDLQSASSLNADAKDINKLNEAQKVETILNDLELHWNEHNIDKVLNLYADDFINGDGLELKAVKNLTTDLWDAYPDVMTSSVERDIRIYGDYATVTSTDIYKGTSKDIREEVGTKGTLLAIATGEVFLKKYGPVWKITSDKTLVEKVSIGYGIGEEIIQENKIKLSAPEQIPSKTIYTTRLEFDIRADIKPVASISKELLIYPQIPSEDKFRLIDSNNLERIFTANSISKNELITSTIGLTGGPLQPKLLGLVFLSQRVNVIPVSDKTDEISIIKEPARSALNHNKNKTDVLQNNKNGKPDTEKINDDGVNN